MAIKQIKAVAEIPSEELDDWGPVQWPISEQVRNLGSAGNRSQGLPHFQT